MLTKQSINKNDEYYTHKEREVIEWLTASGMKNPVNHLELTFFDTDGDRTVHARISNITHKQEVEIFQNLDSAPSGVVIRE